MKTIGRKLIDRELPPRKSRHGKEQVMRADYNRNPEAFDLTEVGIRDTNNLKVANGSTIKKGLINGGSDNGSRASEPQWWKEDK